jgi:tRNA dimethylallyltransferase
LKQKLWVIVGPTAIGKTDFSIELARKLNTSIINADSRQIYKEMRVGTAVPTLLQLNSVPHFLVQHKSIHDYYNAFMFEEEALNIIENDLKNHDNIILAGGSGMYVDAICKGIDLMPTVDAQLREDLDKKFKEEGIESMRFALKRLDREYYDRVDLANPKRMIKGIEVTVQTGQPYSSFLKRQNKERSFQIIKIGLKSDKAIIDDRINRRVDIMVDEGLIEEAKSLYQFKDLNALNTVGYKELYKHFDGDISMKEAIEMIKHDTRIFAKKQVTWFNKDKSTNWFDISDKDKIFKFVDEILESTE